MKVLRLSEKARAAVREVGTLDAACLQELSEFLSSNLEGLLSQDATYEKSEALKKLGHDRAFRMLDALVPVIFGHLSNEQDAKSAVDDVVRASSPDSAGKHLTKSEEKKLRLALSALMLNPQTLLKSKSVRLVSTHANSFSDSEVLSDIRPVFSTDGVLKAEAAVTCHTLRIGYVADSEMRSFYVSLDSSDLRRLKKVVDRAIAKDEAIAEVIGRSGLNHVKVS